MLDPHYFRRRPIDTTPRNHFVGWVLGAAIAGVSLGAFAAIQWTGTSDSLGGVKANRHASSTAIRTDAPVPAEPAKTVPARATMPAQSAETTGMGSQEDRRSSPKCEGQTWPYQSRDCLVRAEPRVRVVPADRVDPATIRAIETPATAAAPAATDNKPVAAPAPGTDVTASVQQSKPGPASSDTAAGPIPQPAPLAKTASAPDATPPAAVEKANTRAIARQPNAEQPVARQPEPESRPDPAATRSKSKPSRVAKDRRKPERKMQAQDRPRNQVVEDDDDEPRIAGRWSRQEYSVPADEGEGRRRVFVIRRAPARDPIGGFFGGLFGGGGGYD